MRSMLRAPVGSSERASFELFSESTAIRTNLQIRGYRVADTRFDFVDLDETIRVTSTAEVGLGTLLSFAIVALMLLGTSAAYARQLSLRDIYFSPQLIQLQGAVEKKVEPRHPELVVGEKVRPVPGWTKFCEDYRPICAMTAVQPQLASLSAEKRQELLAVNVTVNARIKPKTDAEHWGTANERYVYRDQTGAIFDVDKWDYAEDGYGDCEDYVLVKRKTLLLMGWPRSALLITFVKRYEEKKGEKVLVGHAVLTVKTSDGDLILDNMTSEIKRWWEAGYLYEKRQSEEDPNIWLALRPPILARGN
jgi:predicted transglutaminase-like cysteine proteinase